jgi:general secretion pathway protein G
MLLVIVIIGVLASVVVASLSGRTKDARIARAKADIAGSLPLALDVFEQDVGRYPTAEEGLNALVTNPNVPNWRGPYLKTGLKPDPWGNPYVYEVQSNTDGAPTYRLRSNGPDGRPGSEDDIEP